MITMAFKETLVLLTTVWLVSGQRPSFAGTKPIGYPELTNKTAADKLGNRFGDGTPVILPIEANGDRDLIERISKMPVDSQPFWYINWKALEENRKNPQTYEQRPSIFTGINTNRGQSVDRNTDNVNNRFNSNNANQNSNSHEYDSFDYSNNKRGRRYQGFL